MSSLGSRPFPASYMVENFRHFDYNVKPSVGNQPGTRTAPLGAEVIRNRTLWASTTLGANKLYEVREDSGLDSGVAMGQPLFWNRPFMFSQVQNSSSLDLGGPVGECVQGIEMGSFETTIPWQTNFAVANAGPVCQFRYNFTLLRWEVLVWNFDNAVAPDIVPCTVQPFLWNPDDTFPELKYWYLPGAGGVGSRFNCYVNRQLVHSYAGPRLDACYNGAFADVPMAGFFMASGSSATNRMIEAGFYRNVIYDPLGKL